MDLLVKPSSGLRGEIRPQPSKFWTQLAIPIATLAEGKSTLESPLLTKDVLTEVKAVESLGAEVRRGRGGWTIWGIGQDLRTDGLIDAKNSATTLILLASLVSLAPGITVLTGDAQLRSRRMQALLSAFRRLGLGVYSTKPNGSPPLVVFGGGFKGGRVNLPKVMSPNQAPLLAFICPYARKEVELRWSLPLSPLSMEPLVELGKAAGVSFRVTRRKISVPQKPYQRFNFRIPAEFSSVAPFVVAALLTDSRLKVATGRASARDEAFLQALRSFGAEIKRGPKSFIIRGPQPLQGARVNLSGFPELLPFLAVLACKAKGRSILQAPGARSMKSDRISAMAQELKRLGVRTQEQRDKLVVWGTTRVKAGEVDSREDYAVAAALVVVGLLAQGEVVIKNGAKALQTSYTRFISRFKELGAEVSYFRPSQSRELKDEKPVDIPEQDR